MSDASPTVLFEHPLNEKMRTWLRIEFLLQQLHGHRALSDTAIALTFFRTVSDLLDVLERGEVRTELAKELERQQQKLLQWADVPGVDMSLVEQLRSQLKELSSRLIAAPRMGQPLREDKLISLVRQRLGIPAAAAVSICRRCICGCMCPSQSATPTSPSGWKPWIRCIRH
ncbi:Protein of uncharacterised function (DUF1342) [Serratia rubidaea]|uniref:Protein of uncharacterized function (DUF1342) n=1 Tax=Serratia rubidaea TaxID=61652 RepID=A0A447QPB5_SERRU|nr:Protein of uncharacterised function (DUF1342) [Serratia rubidaea]